MTSFDEVDKIDDAKNSAEELNYYERTAGDYERRVKSINFQASELCFKALKVFEEETGISIPKDGKFIDVGAGTGLSGEQLRIAGFTGVVDALEPVDTMFALAKEKGIYSTRYPDMLSPDKETSVPGKAYDLVYSCSVFTNRSATCECLPEAVRMAKNGGVIAVAMNGDHWEGTFDLVVRRMEDEKIVELKYSDASEELFGGTKARVFILNKL